MKLSTVIYICTLTLLFINCKSTVQKNNSTDKYQKIDEYLKEKTKEGFSGSIFISEKNSIKLHEAYGLADREHNVPNNKNTKFEIASITKLFTVVSILQLAEENKIGLNDKISKYLGNFNPPKNGATINQLLLHTAGLVPKGYALDYETKSGFIESVKEAPHESVPGEKYRYTNAGYTLLAAIIEAASQMPYQNYLIEYIFKPLKLSNSSFGFKNSMTNVANGYSGKTIDSLKLYKTADYVWGNCGPSGIISNATDLQLFLQGLDEKKLLNEDSLKKIYFEQIEGEAYGFHVLDKPNIGKILTRGGGLPHFESQIAWYKDYDIKVIILINNHLRTRKVIWDGIEEILFR